MTYISVLHTNGYLWELPIDKAFNNQEAPMIHECLATCFLSYVSSDMWIHELSEFQRWSLCMSSIIWVLSCQQWSNYGHCYIHNCSKATSDCVSSSLKLASRTSSYYLVLAQMLCFHSVLEVADVDPNTKEYQQVFHRTEYHLSSTIQFDGTFFFCFPSYLVLHSCFSLWFTKPIKKYSHGKLHIKTSLMHTKTMQPANIMYSIYVIQVTL